MKLNRFSQQQNLLNILSKYLYVHHENKNLSTMYVKEGVVTVVGPSKMKLQCRAESFLVGLLKNAFGSKFRLDFLDVSTTFLQEEETVNRSPRNRKPRKD